VARPLPRQAGPPGPHANWAIAVRSALLLVPGIAALAPACVKLWEVDRGKFTAVRDDPVDADLGCAAIAASAVSEICVWVYQWDCASRRILVAYIQRRMLLQVQSGIVGNVWISWRLRNYGV
jgi:hypothetical protein